MVLVALGLFASAADLVAAGYLGSRLRSGLPSTEERSTPSLLRSLAASLLMAGPAFLVATHLTGHLDQRWGEQVGMLAAVLTGVVTYLTVQRLWRSPELSTLVGGFRRLRPDTEP